MYSLEKRINNLYSRIRRRNICQVRLWNGMFLVYPYPARRGYGLHGKLVGIYSAEIGIDALIDDLNYMSDTKQVCLER